jgi:hypothetical protein
MPRNESWDASFKTRNEKLAGFQIEEAADSSFIEVYENSIDQEQY